MVNTNLIEAVVHVVSDFYETNLITETNAAIRKRVMYWYNHTDFTDIYTLATLTIEDNINIRNEIIPSLVEFYFPNISSIEYHIGKVEESYHDLIFMEG